MLVLVLAIDTEATMRVARQRMCRRIRPHRAKAKGVMRKGNLVLATYKSAGKFVVLETEDFFAEN